MNSAPQALRHFIENRAYHCCEYCWTQERIIGMALELEHVIPVALGGMTNEENTCLACPRCNRHKAVQISALDTESAQVVQLFNPRQMEWSDHFAWQYDGLYIIGLTAIGRATVTALQMNNPFVVRSRRIWIDAGWHPPKF